MSHRSACGGWTGRQRRRRWRFSETEAGGAEVLAPTRSHANPSCGGTEPCPPSAQTLAAYVCFRPIADISSSVRFPLSGGGMRSHPLKPLHGWRQFIGEVGIIVLGVLIALGASQLVDSAHEEQVKRDTLLAANAEVTTGLQNFVNRRLLEPCIERRFEEVAALLAASPKGGYHAPSWIGRPQFWGFDSAAWDAATAGGRVALLSLNQQTTLGGLYSQLQDLTVLEREEQKAWAEIRQLEMLSDVNSQTRASVRSALAEARLLDWNIGVDSEQPIARAERMGIVGKLTPLGASPSICLPINTPRAEAIKRVNAFFGDNLGEP